jgi:hypothetical protein
MLHHISLAVLVLSLAACAATQGKPESNLALRCEVAKCECQDPAKPFSPAGPVVWNQDGTASCGEGMRLALAKEKSSPITGIVLPTLDVCASSGPRHGSGRLGRGGKTDCTF